VAKTLLDGVNEVLKRVGVIAGDAGTLATLTDSARQVAIDTARQVINEGIDELYSTTARAHPREQAESNLTLSDGQRAYRLQEDLVQIRWPFIDKANNQFLGEYPGGYNQMLIDDPEQDDTGLPHFAALRPTDGRLHLDRTPGAQEAGRTYTYQYDRDLELTAVDDCVPFADAAFRAMVPAWVQLWKREMRNEFDVELFTASLGRASRFLSQGQQRQTWFPR